jgi:hypothetical protein
MANPDEFAGIAGAVVSVGFVILYSIFSLKNEKHHG